MAEEKPVEEGEEAEEEKEDSQAGHPPYRAIEHGVKGIRSI